MRVDDVILNSKELGHLLQEKRLRKGLSQKRASVELGCSIYTISKIEQGAHVPSALTFYKMANLYGFSIDKVLSKVCSSEG